MEIAMEATITMSLRGTVWLACLGFLEFSMGLGRGIGLTMLMACNKRFVSLFRVLQSANSRYSM